MNELKSIEKGTGKKTPIYRLPRARKFKYKLEDGSKLVVNINPAISFDDRTRMVRGIVDCAFVREGDNGERYAPEYIRMAEMAMAVIYFTDYELPEELNENWNVLRHTRLFRDIVKTVGRDIFEIFDEARAAIESRKRYLENRGDFTKLSEKISGLVGMFKDKLGTIDTDTLLGMLDNLDTKSAEDLMQTILPTQDGKQKNTRK